jgi:spermidine dehydrogenase
VAYISLAAGFGGMDLPPVRNSDRVPDSGMKPDYHFQDGNAGVMRMLVRWLIPGSLAGSTMEDQVLTPVDYSALDVPKNDVRIRLRSTVVHVAHDGDRDVAESVLVSYVRDGKVIRVRGGTCVMACFNAIVPYLCPEMAQEQKDALKLAVRKPLVWANVAVSNWRAFDRLQAGVIFAPDGFFNFAGVDPGVGLGGYSAPVSPDDPAIIFMGIAPSVPGLPARDQYRAGRAELLTIDFATYERELRSQLGRMLGKAGFDPARDIRGITINRWAHGYACGPNDLFDPQVSRENQPFMLARKRFGRITIANSDAAGVSMTQAAFDQANRAVRELLTDVVRPSFFLKNPERG